MTTQIHLVRHAESVHNVTKDFAELDPPLTALGFQQATKLGDDFTSGPNIAVVYTSPLRRAIQTTLAAFADVLDRRYYPDASNKGVKNGAELIIDPGLQERSSLRCDTGSPRGTLEQEYPQLDFKELDESWPLKDGLFSADDKAVEERANVVRSRLAERAVTLLGRDRSDIAVVTHGVFMRILSGDPSIDLPKAGWRSFGIERDEEHGRVLLLAPDA